MVSPLGPEHMRRRIDPASLPFETTADLPAVHKPLGQDRAVRALEFGLEVESTGYNIFVLGPSGAGKRTAALAIVHETARGRPAPDDWVVVYNFEDEERPLVLSVPAGTGEALRHDLEALVRSLLAEIPKALSGEEYEREKAAILQAA